MVSTVTNRESNSSVGDSCEACHRTTCEPTQIAITAIKPDRKYTLDLGKPLPEGESNYVLRVLAKSDTPRIIDISLKGNCKQGHGGRSPNSEDYDNNNRPNSDHLCPTAIISSNGIDIDQPSPIKVALVPKKQDAYDGGFKGFLDKYLLPNTLTPARYPIRTHTCAGDGEQSGVVEVFPEASWTGTINLGYEQSVGKLGVQSEKGKIKEQGKYTHGGEIKLDINNESWTIGDEKSVKVDPPFSAITRVLDDIIPFFSDLDASSEEEVKRESNTSLHIDWPQVKLGGAIKTVELKNKPEIDLQGHIHLGFDPLFGATIKVDVLNWLIRVTGAAYSALLIRIREKAEKGIKTDTVSGNAIIGIDLTVSGQIKGDLKWEIEPGEKWIAEKTEIKAGLEIGLEGKVKVEAKVLLVKFTFGAGVHLGSDENSLAKVGCFGSVQAVDTEKGPGFKGKLSFTGAAIYYTYYSELGAESVVSDRSVENNFSRTSEKDSGDQANFDISKKIEESTKLVTLLKPFLWPTTTKKELVISESSI